MSNKVILEAILNLINLTPKKKREIAASIDLPENTQQDLLFMSAILVSTGTNKNGATFLGSELIKARGTIVQKALDIEHKETEIIGHIASCIYLDQEGNVLNDEELAAKLTNSETKEKATKEVDSMDMDIGIVCVVYKDRFPEIAKELEAGDGKWKVSMECYYDDYDLRIGSLIIPRSSDTAKRLERENDSDIKLVLAGKSLGNSKVSRVLRGVKFTGVGIVKNPANERSVIFEAASHRLNEAIDREGLLESASRVTINQEDLTEVLNKKPLDPEVVQYKNSGYFLLKNGKELVEDSYRSSYNEIAKEAIKRTSIDKTNQYIIVEANSTFIPREEVELNQTSDAVAYVTNSYGEVKEVNIFGDKENSALVNRFGPSQQPASVCISFEKYVRQYPGNPNPGKIIGTHWCKMFNKPCPVLGADAQDPSCLRNKYSHLVKEENVAGNVLVEAPFNPKADPNNLTHIDNIDLPQPKTQQEAIENKPLEGDEDNSSNVILTSPEKVSSEPKEGVEIDFNKPVPSDPLPQKESLNINNPYKDFPVKLSKVTASDRRLLVDEEFALPSQRKYPINTKELVEQSLHLFKDIKPKLNADLQKEMFTNLVNAAAELNADFSIENFIKENKELATEQVNEVVEYGLPRLQILPLSTRQQVLAAISRYSHLKVEISDSEREYLIVNILRACNKFNIDSTDFRKRIGKN